MSKSLESRNPPAEKRPWKGVLFPCCGVYGRIYQSKTTGRFEGNCPKCGRPARLLPSQLQLLLAFLCVFGFLSTVHAQDLTFSDPEMVPVMDSIPPETQELQAPPPQGPDKRTPSTPPPGKGLEGKGPAGSSLDSSRLSVFFQLGAAFLGFEDRDRFTRQLDSDYVDYKSEAIDSTDSANVVKQAYQTVNFCFPFSGGLDLTLSENHHLALGSGFIYDREAVVLTDRNADPHEFYYVLQGVPLFLEWRILISPRLMTLEGHDRFSASFRWWWFLPGTEIYSSWGKIKAQPDWTGAGWSFSLGYELFEWKGIHISADLGYSSLEVKSHSRWSKLVPTTDDDEDTTAHAAWSLGGFQMNFRASFALLRRDLPAPDSTATPVRTPGANGPAEGPAPGATGGPQGRPEKMPPPPR
ncbi:MAG TPA: hypothetical protein VLM37_03765 [Fibrobacteraceae bacterium]|nr:hypothetical protein [Fibrobacteraceae bacterium]